MWTQIHCWLKTQIHCLSILFVEEAFKAFQLTTKEDFFVIRPLTFKALITTAADDKVCDIFPSF